MNMRALVAFIIGVPSLILGWHLLNAMYDWVETVPLPLAVLGWVLLAVCHFPALGIPVTLAGGGLYYLLEPLWARPHSGSGLQIRDVTPSLPALPATMTMVVRDMHIRERDIYIREVRIEPAASTLLLPPGRER